MIKAIIDDNNIKTEFFNSIAEFVSLISIMIYLELIELNFCNLNHNLKKNIEIRSVKEYYLKEIFDDDETNI